MTVDLENLKALAVRATPGPWMRLFGERTVYDRMEDGCRGNPIVRADVGYTRQDTENLDFIAAANPAAVLELIAEVERLRTAPAAGTVEMDAARYLWLRDDCPDLEGMTSAWLYDDFDKVIDAAIEAHNKAGKEGA